MVKILGALIVANLVQLLELAGVVLAGAALAHWVGWPGWAIVGSIAALVKSVELDIASKGGPE